MIAPTVQRQLACSHCMVPWKQGPVSLCYLYSIGVLFLFHSSVLQCDYYKICDSFAQELVLLQLCQLDDSGASNQT